MYMSSQCTNDGNYTLTVTFKPGVDLNMAQVLVQNRESLAEPILPDLVKRRGVAVKKKSPSILMIINVFSPDKSRDNLYLSNYATIQLRDELARLDGVGDITYIGQRELQHADLARPAEDVVPQPDGSPTWSTRSTSRTSRWRPASSASRRSPNGQAFQFTITTLGRLSDVRPVRRHDPQDRRAGRRGPPQGCGHASSSAPRATTRSARWTAGRSVALSVYQRPGSNALETAERGPRQDEGAQGSLPRRPRLPDRLRHDPVHRRVGQRGFQHPAGCGHPGRVRRAAVPAELAIGDHPAGRRARGDRRHVRGHGGPRFLAEQPDARSGWCWRSASWSTTRSWSSRRSSTTSSTAWPRARPRSRR